MASSKLVLDGTTVNEVKVVVAFPRKRARFRKWAVVNLESRLAPSELDGAMARVFLALLFNVDKTLKTKDLSVIVGAPTSAVCRALRKLADKSLVERSSHGLWRVSRDLCHFGRWTAPSIPRLQNLEEKQSLLVD